LRRNDSFEIKFRCYFVILALVANALYPSYSLLKDSSGPFSGKIPICTEYGIKYVSYDSDNDEPPTRGNNHCKVCLVGKAISEGFVYPAKSKIAKAYDLDSYAHFYFTNKNSGSSTFKSKLSRAPPVSFV